MARTRTRTDTVYTFDELSESAKDTARDWFREGTSQDFDGETVLEDAARLGAMIGIDIRTRSVNLMGGGTRREPNVYWSVGGRDSGASFDGSYAYRAGSVRAVATEAPAIWKAREGVDAGESKSNGEINRIARTLADVQKRNFYSIIASVGHGRHLNICPDISREDGRELSTEDEETVREALQDFAQWIYRSLESEYEYRMSNAAVDEDIRANEYEFTEDGRRA